MPQKPLLFLTQLLVLGVVLGEEKEEMVDIGPTIGIDLGTTYSCVGVYKDGKVEIIANEQGHRVTPSCVAFTSKGERLIGDAAKSQLTTNPDNTVFDVKRFIGRTWDEPVIQQYINYFPYKLVEKNNRPHIAVQTGPSKTRVFATEEISAMVLGKMKEIAEEFLGKPVTHAVVAVPANFNNAQRQATKDAGTIAGLNVIRIINEPTAAAIAYGFGNTEREKNILVFDLGGGSFDVSILIVDKGAFEVIGTKGLTHLGGEDFNQRVLDYFVQLYKKKTGKNVTTSQRALQKLRREVEKAKYDLSFRYQTQIEIENFFEGNDFSATLSRAQFEELNMDLYRSTIRLVRQILNDTDTKKNEIDEIVLVGGSTRIPKIQQLLSEYFDGKKPKLAPHPDEMVAYGAAYQAAVLRGEMKNEQFVLLDITPLSLGMKEANGSMITFIKRNTVIPTIKSQVWSTAKDNQPNAALDVYEGENSMAVDNRLLASFSLDEIRLAPRGEKFFKVTFEIDANGILKVSAEIRKDQSRLSPGDIDRMIEDAEKYADEDAKVKEGVEARNELESYAYSIKNQLNDKEKGFGEKVSESEKQEIEEAVQEQISWLEKNPDASVEDLKAHKKTLEEVVQPIVSKLYEGQGGPPPPGGDEGAGDERDEL